jgi:hypothetical protein
VVCSGGGAQQKGKQQKGKGKDGAGGGPSNKAECSSGEASTSRGESSRPSTLSTESEGVLDSQFHVRSRLTHPLWRTVGDNSETERQHRMDEAREALQGAMEAMADARCGSPLWLRCIGRHPALPSGSWWCLHVRLAGRTHVSPPVCGPYVCSRQITQGAPAELTSRSKPLVEEARAMLELVAAQRAQRERAVAEEAERLQLEEEVAALAVRMQSDALMMQQMQARLGSTGVSPAAPRAPGR